jgi:hypothetical protein
MVAAKMLGGDHLANALANLHTALGEHHDRVDGSFDPHRSGNQPFRERPSRRRLRARATLLFSPMTIRAC